MALVLGDLGFAVSLCLHTESHTDAISLAAKGDLELLINTQKAYVEKRTANLPHFRFQCTVTKNLADIV